MTTVHGSNAEAVDGTSPEDVDSYSVAGSTSSPGAERKASAASSTAPGKRKREQVATACGNCRMAKLRCNGRHPTCERCRARGIACTYDVAVEGLTRREYLRLQFEEQKDKLERCNVVMGQLVHGTDKEAAELLARLRMGDSVDQLYRRLSPGEDGDEDAKPSTLAVQSQSQNPAYGRPVLPALDVKFLPQQYEDEEAELRALAWSSATTDSFQMSSPELSSAGAGAAPDIHRQYIQDESMIFPVYRRQPFQQELQQDFQQEEFIDPALFVPQVD